MLLVLNPFKCGGFCIYTYIHTHIMCFLTIKKLYILPTQFIYRVCTIPKINGNYFPNGINQFVIVTEMQCVLCDVRTECL